MRIFSSSGSLAGHRDVLRLLPSGAQVLQVFLAILQVHPLGTEVSQNSGSWFQIDWAGGILKGVFFPLSTVQEIDTPAIYLLFGSVSLILQRSGCLH